MSSIFNPRDLIDRIAEQELFTDLVSFTSPARMLTICDKGGRGKSILLKRLQFNCKYEIKPPVPACLIELDQHQALFELIVRIRDELRNVTFPKFDELNIARMVNNFTPFDGSTSLVVGEYTDKADVVQIHTTHPPFTADQQQFVQDKCIEAFFGDLRTICATQPIVLLFDNWERCYQELRDWITNELLGNHCFHPDKDKRAAKLVIVLSSRPYDRVKERYGLRDDEFIPLFADEKEHEATVLSIKSLSDWDSDHVRAFLDQHGVTNVIDNDVAYIVSLLKRGRSFVHITEMLNIFRDET
jgi:hypothetical protein